MQLLRLLFVVLCAGAMIPGLVAADNPARVITLEECIRLALEHNLDVRIIRYDPEIATENLRLARSGYDPNLFIGGSRDGSSQPGYFDPSIGQVPPSDSDTARINAGLRGLLPWGLTYTLSGGTQQRTGSRPFGTSSLPFKETVATTSIQLRQPLLKNFWIDGTRLTIELNEKQLGVSQLTLELQIMTTVTAVETAYYDLILAEDSVRVQEKALQLAERLLAENKKRVEVGAMAPLDEKQAEAQVATTRADLLAAQRLLAVQQNTLKNLLSSEYSEWHNVTLAPAEKLTALPQVFNLTDSWLQGVNQRPDLLQARMDLEQRGIVIKYRRNQLLPQIDVVGSYGRFGTDTEYSGAFREVSDGSGPSYSIGAELVFPLGNRNARSSYRIAQAQREQAVLRMKQLEQNIMVQIDNAIGVAKTQFDRVDATRKAREYAEAALQAEEKKLENGKSTSFFVLQLQRDLTAASSAEAQALAGYNKALAQLALAEGSTLRRNSIEFAKP
jgi:outer membrane protein TolC